MFERFSDRARRAVVLAQEEARRLDHSYIGTEHLLLALTSDSDSIAGHVLASLGVTLDTARANVERRVGLGTQPPSGHIPFTPRAKKVLEMSLREALQLGHDYIGTEHVLLGLVREGSGVGAQVLVEECGDLSLVRQHVIQTLSSLSGTEVLEHAPEPTPVAGDVSLSLRAMRDEIAELRRRVDELTARIDQQRGGGPAAGT